VLLTQVLLAPQRDEASLNLLLRCVPSLDEISRAFDETIQLETFVADRSFSFDPAQLFVEVVECYAAINECDFLAAL